MSENDSATPVPPVPARRGTGALVRTTMTDDELLEARMNDVTVETSVETAKSTVPSQRSFALFCFASCRDLDWITLKNG